MSDEKKPKQKQNKPHVHVQSAILTGPQDVPDFMRQVLEQDRASIIDKLMEIANTDWKTQEDFPGLSVEQQKHSGQAISVFCIYFASMLAAKPLPEFHLATLPMAREQKPGVTH